MTIKPGSHALLVLGVLVGFSLVSITVLAFMRVPIPDVLAATMSTLVGALAGVSIPRGERNGDPT